MPRPVDILTEMTLLEGRVDGIHTQHAVAVANIAAADLTPLERCRKRAEADNAFAAGFEKIYRKWRRAYQRVLNQNTRATRREQGLEMEEAAKQKIIAVLRATPDPNTTAAQTALEIERYFREMDEIRAATAGGEIMADALDAEVDRLSEASNQPEGDMDEEPPSEEMSPAEASPEVPPTSDDQHMTE